MNLPYPTEPLLTAYHNKAFPIGIIQENYHNDDVLLWAGLKSANCIFNTKSPSNKFDVLFDDSWGTREGLTIQQNISLLKETYDYLNIDIIDIIKKQISNRCYVIGTYNERYIAEKAAYGVEDFEHDYLLYGYNDDGFYSAGYVKNGRFRHFHVSQEEFLQGLVNTKSNKISFKFLCIDDDKKISYNFSKFALDLGTYLEHDSTVIDDQLTDKYYGIAAVKRLKKYFMDELSNGFVYLDKRYSKILEEHKMLLSHIFLYLSERNGDFQPFADKSFSVFQKSRLTHRLGIKMTISKDIEIMRSIETLLDQMIEEEYDYLEKAYIMMRDHIESMFFDPSWI